MGEITLQSAIHLGLVISIVTTVFAVGLGATWRDVAEEFREPSALLRALFAIDVVMPVFALAAVAATNLPGPVKIALVLLSISPVPPLLPKKALKAGGTKGSIIGLLVAAALVALVFVPLAVEGLGNYFGVEAHAPVPLVARVLALTILAPLTAGIVAHQLAPSLADRLASPLARFAGILLLLCALPVIVSQFSNAVSLIRDGTLVVFVLFVLVGLTAGYLLGGPEPQNRTTLALATASRHPGLAISIAALDFPDQKLTTAAVVLYLVVNAIITVAYLQWQKRHSSSAAP